MMLLHPFLRLLLCALCAGLAARGGAAQRAPEAPPNILWITVEDMSPRLGAYGDPLAETPHLDRLAREGTRFSRAYVTAPVCSPSRTAIITGMYQTSIGGHHHRATEERPGLPGPYLAVPPPYVKAFTEYLRAAGYYTTNNSKTDYQFGLPATAWDESGNQAHWRNRPEKDQPFFAVFNSGRTHESKVWPDPAEAPVLDPEQVEVPPYYPDTPVVRRDLARHYDNIARMDAWVGEILQQLEEDGLAGRTIVFFFSDHGDGLPRAKRWLYDSGLHVPLLVRWPGRLQTGGVRDDLVSLIDLAPTVLSLAGAAVPAHLQGRVFLGPATEAPPPYVFAARDRMDEMQDMVRAVRDARFKYVRNFYPNQPYLLQNEYRNKTPLMQEILRLQAAGRLEGPQQWWDRPTRPAEELYDTAADPHEVHNLAGDPAYREVLVRLRAALDAWSRDTGDLGLVAEAELVQRFWPGGVQPATAPPLFIPNAGANRAQTPAPEGGAFAGPLLVSLDSPTQGASLAYTTDPGERPRWHLYTGPIRLAPGTTTLRAKAIRYGYRESAEARATFTVTAP